VARAPASLSFFFNLCGLGVVHCRHLISDLQAGELILHFNQQPVFFAAVLALHADQRELALELLSVQHKLQPAGLDTGPHGLGGRFLGEEVFIGPVVPDRHLAGPVLSLGDNAFKSRIAQRMILDTDGQAFLRRVQRWLFRNGPALEDAVRFQAEVVMEPGGMMLLNDEEWMPVPLNRATERFRGFPEIPLGTVLL
jgi:hypothetical protein